MPVCFIKSEGGILILDGTTRLSRMTPTPCLKGTVIQASAQRLLFAGFLPLTATEIVDSSWDTPVAVGNLLSVRLWS